MHIDVVRYVGNLFYAKLSGPSYIHIKKKPIYTYFKV